MPLISVVKGPMVNIDGLSAAGKAQQLAPPPACCDVCAEPAAGRQTDHRSATSQDCIIVQDSQHIIHQEAGWLFRLSGALLTTGLAGVTALLASACGRAAVQLLAGPMRCMTGCGLGTA
jgi:hypothetical protein